MNNKIKNIYKKASVATICTALFKKGLKNQFIQGISPLNKNISKMLGLAFTAGDLFAENVHLRTYRRFDRSWNFQNFGTFAGFLLTLTGLSLTISYLLVLIGGFYAPYAKDMYTS